MILWKKNTHIWRLNNINCFIILFNTRAVVRVEEQSVEEQEMNVTTIFLSIVIKIFSSSSHFLQKKNLATLFGTSEKGQKIF